MKVIDLLNKISNDEEIPKKFKFADQIFTVKGNYIEDEDGDSIFDSMCTDFSNINSEIEIIEEENKKIKPLYSVSIDALTSRPPDILEIIEKLNEVIKRVNE